MSGFSPVLIGETPELREEIEGIFTHTPDAVTGRLTELDEQARLLGKQVTFGAEIEATFVPNPGDPRSADVYGPDIDMDELYEEVVRELIGPRSLRPHSWGKGIVVRPEDNPGPVMLNSRQLGTYNPDQADIIEVRTGPASAEVATTRYWDTIRAIGTIAERHGYMSIILATHINAAVFEDDVYGEGFVDFVTDHEGVRILAAAQHNLNKMDPLQTHAGLQTGVSVLEAYPGNKNASTAIQDIRLEIRHPSIGIVDPRIDMLAVLEAVNRAGQGKLTTIEMDALHNCSGVDVTFEADDALGYLRSLLEYKNGGILWDHQSRKLVMPTLLQENAGDNFSFNFLTRELTQCAENGALDTNGRAVRRVLGALSISHGNLRLRGRDAKSVLRPVANNVDRIGETEVRLNMDKHRVVPTVVYDSPETHAVQRANIEHSSAVRRIMGTSISTLTPAKEALSRRREIIESQMIEETEEAVQTTSDIDII